MNIESFEAWGENIRKGAVTPAVSASDLKRFHEYDQEHHREGVAYGMGLVEHLCSPGADVLAVITRHTALKIILLTQPKLLTPWLHGDKLDEVVFDVAATIPLQGIRLDPDTFVKQLRTQT